MDDGGGLPTPAPTSVTAPVSHPFATESAMAGPSTSGAVPVSNGAAANGLVRPTARSSSLPTEDDAGPNGASTSAHPFASGGAGTGYGPPTLSPRLASLPSNDISYYNQQPLPSDPSQPSGSTQASHPSDTPAAPSETPQKSQRVPSRQLLQTALDLAQRAVEMDKRNDVAGALAAYREAVDKLRTVMARVGVEGKDKGKASGAAGKGKVEEEGRTLRGIHDAYLARIQLLSAYDTGEYQARQSEELAGGSGAPRSSGEAGSSKGGGDDDGAAMGIGNLMLSDNGRDSAFETTMSPPRPIASTSSAAVVSPPRQGPSTTLAPGLSLAPALDVPVTDAERAAITDPFRSPPPTAIPPRSPSRTRANPAAVVLDEPAPIHAPQPQRPTVSTPGSASGSVAATPMATPPMSPDSSSRHSRDMSSPRNRRNKAKPQRSLGLDMEADLTGIDGVLDEKVEVLARPSASRESGIFGGSPSLPGLRSTNASPGEPGVARNSVRTEQTGDDRPLPPLPPSMPGSVLSSPFVDAPSSRQVSSSRKSSLSGIPGMPLDRPPSASGSAAGSTTSQLVSPSTAQGTISQRRHQRGGAGASMTSISEIGAGGLYPKTQAGAGGVEEVVSSIDGLPSTRHPGASPFPGGSGPSSIASPNPAVVTSQSKRNTSGSGHPPPPPPPLHSNSSSSSQSNSAFGRLRARSQPGHRPSQIFRQSISSMGIPGLSSPSPDNNIPPVPTLNRAAAAATAASLRVTTDSPSLGMLAPPAQIAPLTATSSSSNPRSIRSAYALSPRLPEEQPGEIAHRPFHLLRLLYDSMDPDGPGTYITPSLLIDSAVWKPATWSSAGGGGSQAQYANGNGNGSGPGHTRGGASASGSTLALTANNPSLSSSSTAAGGAASSAPKILAQEVKAKCLETLVLHLEGLRSVGAPLLEGPREERYGAEGEIQISKSGMQSLLAVVDEMVAALDALDDEMDHTHKALSGKGVTVGPWKGKTGGGSKSWGSRFSRSVDKMTTGKNADSPERYVDILSHLCYNAQIINEHLACFTGPCTPAYHALPDKSYRQIEQRMMRAAQFFGTVVTPFILDDTKQFVLRYLKGGIKYLEE